MGGGGGICLPSCVGHGCSSKKNELNPYQGRPIWAWLKAFILPLRDAIVTQTEIRVIYLIACNSKSYKYLMANSVADALRNTNTCNLHP